MVAAVQHSLPLYIHCRGAPAVFRLALHTKYTMGKGKASTAFRPLKICDHLLLVSGGRNSKPLPCQFREKIVNNEKLVFLRLEAREPWIFKGAYGNSRWMAPGLTTRTSLMKDLRHKLELFCEGEPTAAGDIRCSGEATKAPAPTDDPMAECSEDEVVVVHAGQAKKQYNYSRARFYKNYWKNQVLAVSMPQRALESGIDEGERMVQLYCEDRRKLWLCTKDADWALAYLRDQLDRKGVAVVAPGDRGPGAGPAAFASSIPPVVAGQLSLPENEVAEVETGGPRDRYWGSVQASVKSVCGIRACTG